MINRISCIISFAICLALTCGCSTSRIGKADLKGRFTDPRVVDLITAAADSNFSEVDTLLKAGVDINSTGVDGGSPLLWVMGTTLDIYKIEYMLKAGANPNYRDEQSQVSPMYLAAGGNRPDILEVLLKNKGNPNLIGPRGNTLLMIAVAQFRDKNVDLLLKAGADLNFTDRHNETVANKATTYGRYDLIAQFLEQGLTHDLQDLAKDVEMTQVPAGSRQQQWKNKVIEMLKVRGVKFPAFVPHKEKDSS